MLTFQVINERERQQLEHAQGPIEFGRGLKRNEVARCVVQDAYVSKDHVRMEELLNGEVRVENLSLKQPVLLPGNNIIAPGQRRDMLPPFRITIGDTGIDVERNVESPIRSADMRPESTASLIAACPS